MTKCVAIYYLLVILIVKVKGISTNFNKMDISEDERRAADNIVESKVISLHRPLQVEKGRKIALASTYHKEGQVIIPRTSFISKEDKEKEEREREEYDHSRPHHYYGEYKPHYHSAGSRIGFPGVFTSGNHRPEHGDIYPHSGYGGPSGMGYGHSGGGYLYPTPPTGLDSGGFMKKQIGLKGLLLPLAGIAILGAAAALTANPVLLQLGTLHGRRRRRRSATNPVRNANVYPVNPLLKPDKT